MNIGAGLAKSREDFFLPFGFLNRFFSAFHPPEKLV